MEFSNEQIGLINKLKKEYNDNGYEIQDECLYEWKIDNWSEISPENATLSPKFNCYGNQWNLILHSKGSEDNQWEYISFFLQRTYNEVDYSLHIPVRAVFYVRNYYDYSNFYCKTLPIQYYISIDDDDYNTFCSALQTSQEKTTL